MHKDKLGQEIKVGSYIVYGHLLGRCAGLRLGKILSINNRIEEYTDRQYTNFTVIGVNDDWGWGEKEPTLCSKKGTLQFPNRMVVLAPEMLNEKVKKLLDEYGE